jgi:hypothetical protein
MRDLRSDAFMCIGQLITCKRTGRFEYQSVSLVKVMSRVRRSVGRAMCRNPTTSVFVVGFVSMRELDDFTQGELCNGKGSTSNRAPHGGGGFAENTRLPEVLETYRLNECLGTPLVRGHSPSAARPELATPPTTASS